jgi:Fic family protein
MTTSTDITVDHIHNSNIIEGVTDPTEIEQSMLAWDLLKDSHALTDTLVLNVHNTVMMNFLPGRMGGRGSYRIIDVEVGGRRCPHWTDVPNLVDAWLYEMQQWDQLDPKHMHVKFEHIHPFIDGNGRTGRLLMWWHERKLGLAPTLIEYNKCWDYYKWF